MGNPREDAERVVAALERDLGTLDPAARSSLLAAVAKANGKPLGKGLVWDLRNAWPRRPERDITRRYERAAG